MKLGILERKEYLSMQLCLRSRSSNQLLDYNLPSVTGQNGVFQNFPATIINTSWDHVKHNNFEKKKYCIWTSSFNLTIPPD